jgi:hypothetical protein
MKRKIIVVIAGDEFVEGVVDATGNGWALANWRTIGLKRSGRRCGREGVLISARH